MSFHFLTRSHDRVPARLCRRVLDACRGRSGPRAAGDERVFRVENQACPRGEVLRLSQQQDERAEGLSHPRQPRRGHEGRHARPRARPGETGRQQADPRDEIRGSAPADAAKRKARGRRDCRLRSVDRRRRAGSARRGYGNRYREAPRRRRSRACEGAAVVGVSGGQGVAAAGVRARRGRAHQARSFCIGETGGKRPDAFSTRRRPHAHPPRVHRSDRLEADLRRGRVVRRRCIAQQIREAARHAACDAAVRRAMGPSLARCRAVRRGQSRQHHEPAVSARVAVPRLGHRGSQQRCAVRQVRQAAAGSRFDAGDIAARTCARSALSRSARRITRTCACRSTSSARCN